MKYALLVLFGEDCFSFVCLLFVFTFIVQTSCPESARCNILCQATWGDGVGDRPGPHSQSEGASEAGRLVLAGLPASHLGCFHYVFCPLPGASPVLVMHLTLLCPRRCGVLPCSTCLPPSLFLSPLPRPPFVCMCLRTVRVLHACTPTCCSSWKICTEAGIATSLIRFGVPGRGLERISFTEAQPNRGPRLMWIPMTC